MPKDKTTHTTVRLPGQLLDTPPVGDTLVTVTLGNTDGVDDLVLLEHAGDADLLLEVGAGKLDLVSDGTAVDLDLHEVGLLLLEAGLGQLGVGEDSDNGAVLLDALELAGDGLAVVLGVLLGVTGERLSLRDVPVLVEAALELVGEVLGPDGGQSAEAAGSLDVADNTDDDHGGSLDDGNGLDDLALVHLCEGLARAWVRGRRQAGRRGQHCAGIPRHVESRVYSLDPGRSRSRTTWVIPAL